MSNELRTHRRYAEFRKGTSDKFYEVEVQELEEGGKTQLTYKWGRIGTNGQQKPPELVYSFRAAVRAADDKFSEKLAKGYVECKSALHALASALETPEDRPIRGLKPAAITTPLWDTGDAGLDERLNIFAQKYIGKLNLIRGSKDDLDFDTYCKQVTNLMGQFVGEWARMTESKQFADLLGLPALSARVGELYRDLRSNAGAAIYALPNWCAR